MKAKSHTKRVILKKQKNCIRLCCKRFLRIKGAAGFGCFKYPKTACVTQSPPQDAINQLIQLYNQGHLAIVVEQAQALTEQYPEAFIIWNVLGAANKGLGRVQAASEAFKKVTELNPAYADGFNNLGASLQDEQSGRSNSVLQQSSFIKT